MKQFETKTKAMKVATATVLLLSFVLVSHLALCADPAPTASPQTAAPAASDDTSTLTKLFKSAHHSRLTNDDSEIQADKRRLVLATGEDRVVDIEFDVAQANGIGVGNAKIVFPQLVKMGEKRQIVFKPLSSGETTVTVRDGDGNLRLIFNVRVTGSNLLRQASEIRDLLRDVEGINIRIVGQKVVVEGEVLVPADYGRLLSVILEKPYSDSLINMTTLSPLALQVIAKKIQDDVNVFAPNVKTRVVNGRIFLEGSVDSFDQARNAERIATLYIPDPRPGDPLLEKDPSAQRLTPPKSIVQTFIVINPPPPRKQEKLVRVTIHFVELTKDYNKVFGFQWAPGFTQDAQIAIGQNGGASSGSASSFSATISSLIPKLESAQTAGFARILKTGTVVVRSGQPALLHDDVEIPYTTLGGNGQATGQTAKVAFDVGLTPLILGQSEDIQMDMKLYQSNLVGRVPSSGAPIISGHRVETKVYIKSNESAAVAGVNDSNVSTDFNKDNPNAGAYNNSQASGGATTQPIFNLLHSKNYTKSKSQFVIFVTPQILDNASEGTEDLKRNFRIKVR